MDPEDEKKGNLWDKDKDEDEEDGKLCNDGCFSSCVCSSVIVESAIFSFLYETEQEFLLSENLFVGDCEEETHGSDCLRRRTAGLKLYRIFACTSSSLKMSMILLFSFAEQSTKPHCQSIFTIDSTISLVTCQWSSGKSTLLQTMTIGTFGPRLLMIC